MGSLIIYLKTILKEETNYWLKYLKQKLMTRQKIATILVQLQLQYFSLEFMKMYCLRYPNQIQYTGCTASKDEVFLCFYISTNIC